MQWRDLERITKENEEQKAVPVYLYHNPEDYPFVTLRSDITVEPGRVYIGPYSTWNKSHDHSFEKKCEKLQKEINELHKKLGSYKDIVDQLKQLLKDVL